nr:hypothetical protein [Nocardia cyriacigeorgica]
MENDAMLRWRRFGVDVAHSHSVQITESGKDSNSADTVGEAVMNFEHQRASLTVLSVQERRPPQGTVRFELVHCVVASEVEYRFQIDPGDQRGPLQVPRQVEVLVGFPAWWSEGQQGRDKPLAQFRHRSGTPIDRPCQLRPVRFFIEHQNRNNGWPQDGVSLQSPGEIVGL